MLVLNLNECKQTIIKPGFIAYSYLRVKFNQSMFTNEQNHTLLAVHRPIIRSNQARQLAYKEIQ